MPKPNNFVITAYSIPHSMGYLATKSGTKIATPLTPLDLMDMAVENGLAGVEFPLSAVVPSFDGANVTVQALEVELASELSRRGLDIVADYGCILDHSAEHLISYLKLAKAVGAKVVRAILSHILCGDRGKLATEWLDYRAALVSRLKEVIPAAEDIGICIAVENHQDADTDDLLYLADALNYSKAFGITLDTGNPLAVGQEPVEATRQLAPIIRHLHLKDYTIHYAPEGFRLVRCVAGMGVVDFAAILSIVGTNGHTILPGIEIAAQATRTIPILDSGWWSTFPPRHTDSLLGVLRILWQKGKPSETAYSSLWESGADSETVALNEKETLLASIQYFKGLEIQGTIA